MKDISKIPDDALLTAEEVADYLGCNVVTIRTAANKGQLPFAHRVKRLHVFASNGLKKWLSDPPPNYKPGYVPVRRRRKAKAA